MDKPYKTHRHIYMYRLTHKDKDDIIGKYCKYSTSILKEKRHQMKSNRDCENERDREKKTCKKNDRSQYYK